MTVGLIPNLCPSTLVLRQFALSDGGYTYIAGVRQPTGAQVVARIDHSTLKVDQMRYLRGTYAADTHMVPATIKLPDGTLGVLYTGHSENDGLVHFRKSSSMSPMQLGSEVTALALTQVTYVMLFVHGNSVYAMSQDQNAGTNGGWFYAKSTDSGATWGTPVRMFRGTTGFSVAQFYQKGSDVTDGMVTFFCQAHPNNSVNPCRVFTFNLETEEIIDSNGTVTFADYSNMQSIRTPAALRSQDIQGVSPDGTRVWLRDRVTADLSDARSVLGRLTPGQNPTLAASWTFTEPSLPGVTGGLLWDSRDPTGNTAFMVSFTTPDRTIDQWTSADDGDTWIKGANIVSTTSGIPGPTTPRNPSDAIPIIWPEGTETTFLDWAEDTRWAAE